MVKTPKSMEADKPNSPDAAKVPDRNSDLPHDNEILKGKFVYSDQEPFSESCGHSENDSYYLTHAIWHNSYGSYQPETGVRAKNPDGSIVKGSFWVIQHNWDDWPRVTAIIFECLKKGWGQNRIYRLFEYDGFKRRLSHVADKLIEREQTK